MAKMINYHDGDYHDENDPAVRLYRETAAKMNSPKSPPGPPLGGCVLVVLAITSLSAALAAAGIGIGNFIG